MNVFIGFLQSLTDMFELQSDPTSNSVGFRCHGVEYSFTLTETGFDLILILMSTLAPLSSLFLNFHWKSTRFHEQECGRIPLKRELLLDSYF